jgi:hypothetical protein
LEAAIPFLLSIAPQEQVSIQRAAKRIYRQGREERKGNLAIAECYFSKMKGLADA